MGTKGNAIDDTGPDSGGSVSWPQSALVGKLYSVDVEIKFRACINHESGWWPLRAARTPPPNHNFIAEVARGQFIR